MIEVAKEILDTGHIVNFILLDTFHETSDYEHIYNFECFHVS